MFPHESWVEIFLEEEEEAEEEGPCYVLYPRPPPPCVFDIFSHESQITWISSDFQPVLACVESSVSSSRFYEVAIFLLRGVSFLALVDGVSFLVSKLSGKHVSIDFVFCALEDDSVCTSVHECEFERKREREINPKKSRDATR